MTAQTKEKTQTLKGLNKAQEKAVIFGQGPLLIIAGAGTGKTTVLTRRIVWLIEQDLAKPEEILALTFTEKAAKEMEERVDLLMPLGYAEINISTFHAFAQKILSEHALDIGLPGDFKLLTETQAWMLVKKHLNDFDLDYYRPVGNPNKFIHAMLKHFNKLKGEEVSPEDYLKYAEGLRLDSDSVEIKKKARKKKTDPESSSGLQVDPAEEARVLEVANAYHRYQKLLLDNSFLDFGDLINFCLRLFRQRPKILAKYQTQFKYILVDEFQDTDLAQYELVKMLAKPENNITVVGDDDQSIYKFRGASISNILKYKEDYPQAKEVTLTENYRSTQNILDQAYGFIQQNNPERLEARLKISKRLVSCLTDKGELAVIHAKSVHEEAAQTIDKLIEIQERKNLGFNDFAILVRANDHAEPFIAEMTRRGLPFMFLANRGLYKKPFILDLLAYLRLLDNYHESDNLFRVFSMPKFRIAETELIQIAQLAKRRTLSLYEAAAQARTLPISDEAKSRIDGLMNMLAKHTRMAASMPVSELLVRILDELGLAEQLLVDSWQNSENRSLVEQFYRKTQNYESENDDKTVKGFLNQIRLELEAGDQGDLAFNPDVGPEAIKVMTVHSSKGLEFACVFVANLVDQRFPSRARGEQIEVPQALVKEILPEGDAHLMEERRLFYVAMTRAKRFLYLTWADDYGGSQNKKPSRFLVELGLEEKAAKPGPVGQVFFAKQQTLIKPTTSKIILPDTFSFSQISTFLHCPLEYKYKYIYHLPLPGEAQLSFGVTIHKTLEKYLRVFQQPNSQTQADLFGPKKAGQLELPKKGLLVQFYKECWMDDWFADKIQKERYQALGLKILENFYEKFSVSPKMPKFLEQPFKLRLGNYRFVGKIDRADQNSDSTISIVDYKTGEAKEKLSPVDKQQLLIYQWAAQEQFHEKVKSLCYWYLNSTKDSIEFLGKPDEIEQMKTGLLEEIEAILEATRTGNFGAADRRISHECKFRHLE